MPFGGLLKGGGTCCRACGGDEYDQSEKGTSSSDSDALSLISSEVLGNTLSSASATSGVGSLLTIGCLLGEDPET
jgi:hypothetical protein